MARNFQQGHGFSTSILYYDEHFRLSTWPAPQTVFPIGFPILISALGMLGVPLRLAAFLISAAGFMMVPPLITAAALRMGQKPTTALLLAMIWLCLPMNWGNVEESQTDMLFTALTLGGFVLLIRPTVTARQLLLSGLCAAIAFSVRYAGVFWLMTVGLIFVASILQRQKPAFKHAVQFFVVPVAMVVMLFLRNKMLVGDIKGGNNYGSGQSFAFSAMEAYYCLSRITGLDQDALMRGHFAEMLFAAGLIILICITVPFGRRVHRLDFRSLVALPITLKSTAPLYVVMSVATLIWLETTTSIHLSPRMFFPVIPFALLSAADLIGRLGAASKDISILKRRLIPLASGMMVVGLLAGQTQSAGDVASQIHRYGMVAEIVETPAVGSDGSIEARQLMADTKILTSEPHMLAEYLERGVIGLTENEYTSQVWTDDAVVSLIRHYGVNQVVFFPDLPTDDTNPFFRSLRRFEDGHEVRRPWLNPVLVTPRIQIYEVIDGTQPCKLQCH